MSSYEKLTEEAGLSWPIAEDLNLEEILIGRKQENPKKPLPEWDVIHREMKRKGVTLKLLWEEYEKAHPGGKILSSTALPRPRNSRSKRRYSKSLGMRSMRSAGMHPRATKSL